MTGMRQFMCGQKSASVLGFGCGSVLGRVGRRDSLRAMQCAWDAGITLFETARSYGFGLAEAVLGDFLDGRRDQATVITKYGILPQNPGLLNALATPAARAAARFVPSGLLRRRKQHRRRQVSEGVFSVPGLRASVESSLRALQTDYLDVLLLHEATAATFRQDELVAELGDLMRQGKILRAGLYATRDVVAMALAEAPTALSVMEYGADLLEPALAEQAQARGTLLIGNHPFQSDSHIATVSSVLDAIRSDESMRVELRTKLHNLEWAVVHQALLGAALTVAGFDALVFSMMQADHIQMNLRAIESNPFSAEELSLLFHALQGAPGKQGFSHLAAK